VTGGGDGVGGVKQALLGAVCVWIGGCFACVCIGCLKPSLLWLRPPCLLIFLLYVCLLCAPQVLCQLDRPVCSLWGLPVGHLQHMHAGTPGAAAATAAAATCPQQQAGGSTSSTSGNTPQPVYVDMLQSHLS
jgi:hypothetical protein